MRLKYYIRSLGLGIFVTALLMGLATTPKTKEAENTDASESASSTNMVLSETVLSTAEGAENKGNQEITEDSFEKEGESEAKPEMESESEPESKPESESENEPIVESKDESPDESKSRETSENATAEVIESETADQGGYSSQTADNFVELEIRRGESSDKVSRKLQELGLIEDAKSFDRYLCNNGYDKRISVGNYLIPSDSSEEEIALIISGKKK